MMYTSTNGRKIPCVCHLRSLAATTDAGGKWDKTSVEIKRANDVKEKRKEKEEEFPARRLCGKETLKPSTFLYL